MICPIASVGGRIIGIFQCKRENEINKQKKHISEDLVVTTPMIGTLSLVNAWFLFLSSKISVAWFLPKVVTGVCGGEGFWFFFNIDKMKNLKPVTIYPVLVRMLSSFYVDKMWKLFITCTEYVYLWPQSPDSGYGLWLFNYFSSFSPSLLPHSPQLSHWWRQDCWQQMLHGKIFITVMLKDYVE